MSERNQSIITALKQSPLLSCLTDLQIDRVYKHCELFKLTEGQQLFSQGEDVKFFFLVLRGKVKLFRVSPDGQEKIIEIVPEGAIFAEALMFMDKPHYPVSAAALSESVVIGIDAQNFKDMLLNSVDTCLLLMGNMSFRLRGLINEIDRLTLHTGTCRIASYLIQHSPEDEECFELDIPKSVIAARLSVKPETFSRITKRLRDTGVLSINGNKITIHDREALRELSLI